MKALALVSTALALLLGVLLAVTWRRLVRLQRVDEEQARLQRAIQNAAREWQLTFDAVESALLVVGVDGRLRRVNRAAARLAGKDLRALLGQPVADVAPGEPWQTAGVIAEVVAESREAHASSTEDRASGRTWDLAATLSTGQDPADDRIVIVARDITGIVRLQRSLRRSEVMSAMGALVAGVAHEVRNPLFAISAVVDAFENRFGRRDEQGRYLEVLKSQLNRLNTLMRELLEYGKPPMLSLASERLDGVVAEAIRNCDNLAESAGVAVAADLDPDLPRVMMDRDRMLQVFQNLLENAIQHTPGGETVRVEARPATRGESRWAVCRILDNGPGFHEEDLARVFEPFFTRRREGTGLGLSLVQRIIEQHGGRIQAGNRPGGGGVMELRLPVEPAAGEG